MEKGITTSKPKKLAIAGHVINIADAKRIKKETFVKRITAVAPWYEKQAEALYETLKK